MLASDTAFDPDRMLRIADVEQQTEPGAGAAREADFRIYGDVVALIRTCRRRLIAAAGPGATRLSTAPPPPPAPLRDRGDPGASRSSLCGGTGRPWNTRGELTMAAVTGGAQRDFDDFETESRRVRTVGAAVGASPALHPPSARRPYRTRK